MSKGRLLVTGATGLVGSNLCVAAVKAGYEVRGLVRSKADTEPLVKAGVELVLGDVTDPASLDSAARGVDGILHAAAVIGGTWSKATPDDFWSVNYLGVLNVLDAAKKAGARRTVCYSSVAILDWGCTQTNTSPIVPIGPADPPYTRAKRAAFYASMHRACLGENIVTVLPGMIYGPAPVVQRALVPTSCTGTLVMALKGELKEYVPMPMSFSYAHDVGAVGLAAYEKGTNGSRYLACGRAEDVCGLPEICNRASEIAGVVHRVATIDLSKAGNSLGSMKAYAERKFASPLVDTAGTEQSLGVAPTPLSRGLAETVAWLREVGVA